MKIKFTLLAVKTTHITEGSTADWNSLTRPVHLNFNIQVEHKRNTDI